MDCDVAEVTSSDGITSRMQISATRETEASCRTVQTNRVHQTRSSLISLTKEVRLQDQEVSPLQHTFLFLGFALGRLLFAAAAAAVGSLRHRDAVHAAVLEIAVHVGLVLFALSKERGLRGKHPKRKAQEKTRGGKGDLPRNVSFCC